MTKITLATIASATAQQVFDQVRDHLLRQGKRSTFGGTESGVCAYRGVDGLQCAAGCLMADDEYSTTMEGTGWGSYMFPQEHRQLIMRLQVIHDEKPVELWEPVLRDLATEFGLAWTVSLATLPTASAQEVFEQAAKHLLKQNRVCRDGSSCAYRGPVGACAAGALLSEADAALVKQRGMNTGSSWGRLVYMQVAPATHQKLIERLQTIHDDWTTQEWRSRLRMLAVTHQLDSSFMDLPLVVYVPPAH